MLATGVASFVRRRPTAACRSPLANRLREALSALGAPLRQRSLACLCVSVLRQVGGPVGSHGCPVLRSARQTADDVPYVTTAQWSPNCLATGWRRFFRLRSAKSTAPIHSLPIRQWGRLTRGMLADAAQLEKTRPHAWLDLDCPAFLGSSGCPRQKHGARLGAARGIRGPSERP